MAVEDFEKCCLCGGEKIAFGIKTKVKLEALFICATCDPHLVVIAKKRRARKPKKIEPTEPEPE